MAETRQEQFLRLARDRGLQDLVHESLPGEDVEGWYEVETLGMWQGSHELHVTQPHRGCPYCHDEGRFIQAE